MHLPSSSHYRFDSLFLCLFQDISSRRCALYVKTRQKEQPSEMKPIFTARRHRAEETTVALNLFTVHELQIVAGSRGGCKLQGGLER